MEKKLGSGIFGVVYKGEMKNKQCAVKVLHEISTELSLNPSTVSEFESGTIKVQEARVNSFENERKTLVNLEHPNIVKLLTVCFYPRRNMPWLVMELLDCSLRGYLIQTSGNLPLVVQISLSCDIANALAFLHENKIIHRDLCGDNILIQKQDVTATPVAKIADFGMSRIIDPETMTHSVSLLDHRNGYLPPEGPNKDYDLSLDIHMFGVILVQIVHAVQNIKSPEERAELINKIEDSHPLRQLIKSCVEIVRSKRPNAETVYKELQNLLQER